MYFLSYVVEKVYNVILSSQYSSNIVQDMTDTKRNTRNIFSYDWMLFCTSYLLFSDITGDFIWPFVIGPLHDSIAFYKDFVLVYTGEGTMEAYNLKICMCWKERLKIPEVIRIRKSKNSRYNGKRKGNRKINNGLQKHYIANKGTHWEWTNSNTCV